MNEVTSFTNEEFGAVRTVTINGEPWLVGKDVAAALGYSNASKAVMTHVDDEDKQKQMMTADSQNGNVVTETTLINESGLYSLVLSSKLPNAKKFRRWVTSEVLPSVRKHGAYATEETIDKIISDPDFGIKLLTELKEERKKNAALSREVVESQKVIEQMKPKADYVDMILKSNSVVTATQIAKDYGMSGTAFNKLLYALNIQWKVHGQWVLYAQYAGRGYTHSYTWGNEAGASQMSTRWTQKGRLFLYEELKKAGYLPLIEKGAA